ncbi:MAG TPA: glycosyltransferase family 2 protein, partial [Caldimonas sp.]|nr:glycosyltransferase family 2 protein [Caldimonas sp.]
MSAAAAPDAIAARLPPDGLTSVVVVAADSGPGLLDCTASVLASTAPVELIVVDNASHDGCSDAVATRWPRDARITIVRNERNLGFGTGCNRGAAVARGDALLFLNPDCVVAADAVARLRAALEAGNGLLGVTIVDADGAVDGASRRRDPLLRRALMTMTGLARLEADRPRFAGVALPPRTPAPELEPVDAVSGALMLLPRAVFDRVGGFRVGLSEDMEWCQRAIAAGYRIG